VSNFGKGLHSKRTKIRESALVKKEPQVHG
jgi:hypothetical protein